MTGSASAASTWGGTGVGPGVNRYFLRLTPGRLAMGPEDDDLLEGRAVRPAHRVRDEPGEPNALAGRVGTPRRGVRALRGRKRVARCVERLPERDRAGIEVAVAAVARREARAAEQPLQIALDVAVPPAAVGAPARVGVVRDRRERLQLAGERTEHGLEHGDGETRPPRIHDRRAGVVDLPVEACVEPAAVPLAEQPEDRVVARARRR